MLGKPETAFIVNANTINIVLGTDPKENTAFNNSPIVALWGIPHTRNMLVSNILIYFNILNMF
jgi:hypothetical protein